PSTPATSTLSLHDALPICHVPRDRPGQDRPCPGYGHHRGHHGDQRRRGPCPSPSPRLPVQGGVSEMAKKALIAKVARKFKFGVRDRKSTRLNSSHVKISYA